MEITDLQRRIRELENENKYLKSLLDHAGISYVSLLSALPDDDIFTSDQGSRIIHVEITRNHFKLQQSVVFQPDSTVVWSSRPLERIQERTDI